MKRITLLAAPIVLISFAACNNGRAYNPDTRIETPSANQPVQTAAVNDTNPQTGLPVTTNQPAAPSAGAAGLNPAHGQPGHRCDIAVGAPLSSAPAAVAPATQPTTTPATNNLNPVTITPTTQPAKPTTGAAGLNPAHGQPGHRCDIAVGAPLNSKPTTTTTTTPQPGINNTTIANPVAIQPQAAPQKVAPGMNPAHGQPGHRCDIDVGSPLNSKPAATNPTVSPLQPTTQVSPLAPVKIDTTKN